MEPTNLDYFFPACLPDTLCISYTPINPATETIKAHGCSATNPTALLRKLKIAPTTLPTTADNASTASLARLLSASANLSNHFFKISLSFGAEASEPPSPPPKAAVIASTIVKIVMERAVSIDIMVITCSRNKVQIFPPKMYLYQVSF